MRQDANLQMMLRRLSEAADRVNRATGKRDAAFLLEDVFDFLNRGPARELLDAAANRYTMAWECLYWGDPVRLTEDTDSIAGQWMDDPDRIGETPWETQEDVQRFTEWLLGWAPKEPALELVGAALCHEPHRVRRAAGGIHAAAREPRA